MIFLPIISLGFLILSVMGALVSFQYFTHYQTSVMLERAHIADQRQKAQNALGFLVAFSFAAVISLGGLILPVIIGYTPEPAQPTDPTAEIEGVEPTLSTGDNPADQLPAEVSPTPPTESPTEPTPTQILPRATIGNTGGAGANIRSLPGLNGAIVEVLADGTRVILLDETEEVDGFEWQHIEMPDTRTGWVVVQFLLSDN
jgi:hypothetical protein